MSQRPVLAVILAMLCVLCWSFIPVIARLGQNHMDNLQLLFWSNLLSALVVGACVPMTGKRFKFAHAKDYAHCAGLGALGCFLCYVWLYYAYAHGHPVTVMTLQYSWPALIVILSMVFLKESRQIRKIIGVALGMGTIAWVASASQHSATASTPLAIACVLANALAFAVYSVWSKTIKAEATAVIFWCYFFATIYSAVSVGLFSQFRLPEKSEWLPILLNGFLVNGVSTVFWAHALRLWEASRLAPLVFMSPALGIVWLSLIFNLPVLPAQILGLVLAIASGLLCAWPERRKAA